MADTKISELPQATAPLGGDELVPIVQGGATVKAEAAALGLLQKATVTLTAEDIAALDTTPFTLVAAPGAGKAIVPVRTIITTTDGAPHGTCDLAIQLSIGGDVAGYCWTTAEKQDSQAFFAFPILPSAYCITYASNSVSPAFMQVAINADLQIAATTEFTFTEGGVGTVSVNAGGTGYAEGDTGVLTNGSGTAAYFVTSVSDGAVVAVNITDAGYGYSVGEGAATAATTGTGEGLTLDIETLATPTMGATITTYYTVVDV